MGNGAIGTFEAVMIDLATPLGQLDVDGIVALCESIFQLNLASDDGSTSTAEDFAGYVDQFLCGDDSARFAEVVERLSQSLIPAVRASVLPALESFARIHKYGETDETGEQFECRILRALLDDLDQGVVDRAGQYLSDRKRFLDNEGTHDSPGIQVLAEIYL